MNLLMIFVILAFLFLRHGSLSCQFHEQNLSDVEQILMQTFKKKLLKELGFSSVPNVSKILAPKIPSFYKHLIEAENSKPIQTTESDKDDFHAKTKRLFLFPEQGVSVTNGIGKNYIFKSNRRHSMLEIKSATLWIRITETSTSVEKPDHGKRAAELQLYKSYQAAENGLRAKELFYSEQLKGAGWYKVTVSEVVKEWFSMQSNLHISLDIAVKGTKFLEIDGGDVSDNGGPLQPFLAVDTEEKQHVNRHKRSRKWVVFEECRPATSPRCCKHKLNVDFDEMEWYFIIAPKLLETHVCAGSCRSPAYNAAFRAKALNIDTGLEHACCVPKSMGLKQFLMVDQTGNVLLRMIPMEVLSCQCIT